MWTSLNGPSSSAKRMLLPSHFHGAVGCGDRIIRSTEVALIYLKAAFAEAASLARAGEERLMRARDVMVRAVATTTPEITVEEVARLMINLRISGVPVLDRNGQLVGIVTEGDLLRRAETGTERRHSGWSEWFSSKSGLAAEYVKSHAR